MKGFVKMQPLSHVSNTHTAPCDSTVAAMPLIWSLPCVATFFIGLLAFFGVQSAHLTNMFSIAVLCFGFSATTAFIYSRIPALGFSVFLGILLIVICGIGPDFLEWLYWLIAAVCGLKLLGKDSLTKIRRFGILSAVVSCFLIFVQMSYFTLQYSQPFNDTILLSGGAHMDTLYHASVSAMIKNYHVVSHGLHGLGPLEYHFGSHVLMASASKLLHMSILDSYGYFFVFFCIPLIGIMAIATAEDLQRSSSAVALIFKCVTYVFLIIGTGIFVPGSWLAQAALWPSFFESESYAVSLIALFCLISCLLSERLEFTYPFRFFGICLLLSCTTLAKISTGAYGLLLIGLWTIFPIKTPASLQPYKRWCILAACTFLFLMIRPIVSPLEGAARFEAFSFYGSYVKFPGPFVWTYLLFICLQFLFPLMALSLVAIPRIRADRLVFIVAPKWLVAGIIAISICGIVVISTLEISGGAGYYFANPSMFVAFPILISMPQYFYQKFRPKEQSSNFVKGLLIGICILGLSVGSWNGVQSSGSGFVRFFRAMKATVQEHPITKYIKFLQVVRDEDRNSRSVVYIPRTEVEFWNGMDCKAMAHLIPAISEKPALFAWPEAACYSFLCGPRFHSNGLCAESQKVHNDVELLSEAVRLGFDEVDVVTSTGIRTLK